MSEQPVAPIRSASIIRPATVNDGGQQPTVFSTGPMQIVQGSPRPNMNVLVVKQHEAASATQGYVLVPHGSMPQTTTTIIRQPMNMVGQQMFVRTQAPLAASSHLVAGAGTNTSTVTASFMVQSSASTGDSLNGASVDSNGTASGATANRPIVGMPRTPSTGASNELVAKCNQFFNTLLQLASHQSKTTHEAVRNLAQSLIDGKINAQTFTARLQEQLNSTPQPNLVPFLDKTLPAFRSQLALGRMQVDGIRAPPSADSKSTSNESQNGVESEQKPAASMDKLGDTFSAVIDSSGSHDGPRTPSPAARVRPSKPVVSASASRKAAPRTNTKAAQPVATPASASDRRPLADDDEADEEALDNLMEEKQASASNTLVFTARSFRDDNALDLSGLRRRTSELANRAGLDNLSEGALQLLANAVQQRLRLLLEQLTVVTEHRLELYARDPRFEPLPAGDAKASFKTLEDADRLEQARHAKEQEQSLLRAAKSRTKNDDPDQAKLKQKAKELAQAQLEEKKQQAANLTALAAIGGARKRKFDEPAPSTSTVSVDSPLTPSVVPIIRQTAAASQPAPSSSQSASSLTITRLKRATMKDLLFVLEQSPDYAQSKLLYRLAMK